MKVLVTGGAGFIGSHIVEYYQSLPNVEVRVLDNLHTGLQENIANFSNIKFIQGSILDCDIVQKAVQGVDYVFHLAALVSVPESIEKPVDYMEVNIAGLLNVLVAASRAKVRKLCFPSSAAVYGDLPEIPKHETMSLAPKSPYAVTKRDGEYFCNYFREQGLLNTVCLRYFNVFGPRQNPRSSYAAAVSIFLDKACNNQPIEIFGDGEQTRDFIYVKDVVKANVFLAEKEDAHGIFNVAYGQKMSIKELARKIIEITGSQSTIRYVAERPGDIKHSVADIGQLKNAGFKPASDFAQGLQDTAEFFRASKNK